MAPSCSSPEEWKCFLQKVKPTQPLSCFGTGNATESLRSSEQKECPVVQIPHLQFQDQNIPFYFLLTEPSCNFSISLLLAPFPHQELSPYSSGALQGFLVWTHPTTPHKNSPADTERRDTGLCSLHLASETATRKDIHISPQVLAHAAWLSGCQTGLWEWLYSPGHHTHTHTQTSRLTRLGGACSVKAIYSTVHSN